MNFMRIRDCAVAMLIVSAAACDLDLQDPNIPLEENVIPSAENMIAVAIGLQAEYSNQLAEPVYITGMVTNELGANTSTFESFRILDTGSGPATNDLGGSTGPWTGQYRVIHHAEFLLEHAPNVGRGPGYVSGMMTLGKLYKAMAMGNLIQVYERIVTETEVGATLADRNDAITQILTLLDEAAAHLATEPPSPEFTSRVPAAGFNLENTIHAMRARYNLIAGNLTAADDAAADVDPAVFSEYRFAASDPNPVWNLAVNGGNSTSMRPKDSFRLSAEANDGRVAYWVTEAALTGFAEPLDNFARFGANVGGYPAYLPDEMKLIRAEVAARENRLGDAITLINDVREPCTSALPEPIACLPALTAGDLPTQDDVLAQVLYERRYELYLQHVRWSDLRRFSLTPKYMWMPVPNTECDRNPSIPEAACLEQPAAVPHDS